MFWVLTQDEIITKDEGKIMGWNISVLHIIFYCCFISNFRPFQQSIFIKQKPLQNDLHQNWPNPNRSKFKYSWDGIVQISYSLRTSERFESSASPVHSRAQREVSHTTIAKFCIQFTLLVFCSIDQVRSLASSMHNGDGYFQYFVVDFRNMDSAYHGSSILKQAVFANDAIKRIRALYASQGAVKQDSEGEFVSGYAFMTKIDTLVYCRILPHPECGSCCTLDRWRCSSCDAAAW